MNRTELKAEIEKNAKEANCTEIEMISAMQTLSVDNDEMMEALADIKWDYIEL
jgi:hypothetical protein